MISLEAPRATARAAAAVSAFTLSTWVGSSMSGATVETTGMRPAPDGDGRRAAGGRRACRRRGRGGPAGGHRPARRRAHPGGLHRRTGHRRPHPGAQRERGHRSRGSRGRPRRLQADHPDRRRRPLHGLAGPDQPRPSDPGLGARRAAAKVGVRHGAQDGGLPAGGPRRGSAGARCRRQAGALGAHRGVHPAGCRHHGAAGRPEHWRTADRATRRCRMSDLAQRGGGELTGTGAEWTARYSRALMNTFGPPKRVLVRGEGAYVWDADGKRYLDLLAGIAVNALGHAHPTLTAAISAQLGTLGHVSNFFATPAQVALAERLLALAGGDAASRVFFT